MMRFLVVCSFILWPLIALAVPISFTWDGVDDPSRAGYIVEKRLPGGVYREIARLPQPPWIDPDAQLQACYRVLAYNALGTSKPSNILCLSIPFNPENLRQLLTE